MDSIIAMSFSIVVKLKFGWKIILETPTIFCLVLFPGLIIELPYSIVKSEMLRYELHRPDERLNFSLIKDPVQR